MVKSAKEIAYIGIAVALLICSQLALSAVSGIEVVTAIFTAYCFVFGVFRGVLTATVFSLVRCVIFGFFPQVVVLYLIYYNLFAICVGLLGKLLRSGKLWLKMLCITATAVFLTVVFTMLDNLLNAVMFSLSHKALQVYIAKSLPVMFWQMVCVAITVPVLFYPLYKVFTVAIGAIAKQN